MQNGFGTLQESQLLLAKLTFTLALFLIKSGEWESWLKVIWNNHSHCTVVNPMSLIQHGQIMPHHAFPRHLREMWFHKWLSSHLEAKTSDSLPKSSPKVSITITLMSINPLEPHSSGTLFNMVFKQNMVTGSFIEAHDVKDQPHAPLQHFLLPYTFLLSTTHPSQILHYVSTSTFSCL